MTNKACITWENALTVRNMNCTSSIRFEIVKFDSDIELFVSLSVTDDETCRVLDAESFVKSFDMDESGKGEAMLWAITKVRDEAQRARYSQREINVLVNDTVRKFVNFVD